jgi:hypothetical protein
MKDSRLRVQMDVDDLLMRESNIDKDKLKVMMKRDLIARIGEELDDYVDLLVDTTKPDRYQVQGEVWVFDRDSLMELLNQPDHVHREMKHKLKVEKNIEGELLESKELIKYQKL